MPYAMPQGHIHFMNVYVIYDHTGLLSESPAGVESNPSEWLVKQLANAQKGADLLIVACMIQVVAMLSFLCTAMWPHADAENGSGGHSPTFQVFDSTYSRCRSRCAMMPRCDVHTSHQCVQARSCMHTTILNTGSPVTSGDGGIGGVCAACAEVPCEASRPQRAHHLGALWSRQHRQHLQAGGELCIPGVSQAADRASRISSVGDGWKCTT